MPTATLETPVRISPRLKMIDKETRELCKALYIRGLLPVAIARQTGVKRLTIIHWAARFDWKALRDKVDQLPVDTSIGPAQNDAGERLKGLLSNELLDQAEILKKHPARTMGELSTDKERQGRAQTVRHMVESGDRLHGWSNEQKVNNLLQVGTVNLLAPDASQAEEVIDVDAVKGESLPNPELEKLKKENEELRQIAKDAVDVMQQLEGELADRTPQAP